MNNTLTKLIYSVCMTLALLVAGCASDQSNKSTGEYIDDAAITVKVKSKLAASDETSALAIEVDTYRGVVQLSGFVDTSDEQEAAERIAEEVPGVRDVENNITVKSDL